MSKDTKEQNHIVTDHNHGGNFYTLDDAIEKIGVGKFHIVLMLLTGFAWTAESMQIMVISIISPILVCDWKLSAYKEAMIATTFFTGMGAGSIVWGILSDRIGRKKSLISSFALVFVCGILSSRAPSYSWILVFQFILGFGIGGGPQVPVFVTEILPLEQRGGAVIMLATFWALGSVFAASLALAVIDIWKWRYYLVVVTSPLAIFLIGSFWIPESPRYLLNTGQITKLKSTLERIAKMNQKSLPEGILREVEVKTKQGRVIDLFSKGLYQSTLTILLLWFTLTYSYYGIVLLMTSMLQSGVNGCHPHANLNSTHSTEGCKRLNANDYKDVITTTVAEFPGVLVAFFLINTIGRRKAVLIQLSIATLSYILLSICTSKVVSTIFMFVTRGLLDGCAQTLYVYTAELLPTNVRAIGVGLGSLLGRVGAMVTPFAAQVLIQRSFYLVIVAYAAPLILCICIALLLKIETNQRLLPDSSELYNNCNGSYDTFK